MPRKETPRESTIVKQIAAALRARPRCLVLKYHGGPYAVAGHPDLYGCDDGRAFAFEVKRSGERPTPLQQRRLEEWRAAGAITGVVTSGAEALALLGSVCGRDWLGPLADLEREHRASLALQELASASPLSGSEHGEAWHEQG